MSEHHINVVRLGAITPHPNADSLSITMVHGGYPCIIRTGDFAEGDLAVYVPVDALVPTDDPRFAFLADQSGKPARIKARRLRGVFSMGLLVKPDAGVAEGDDVAEALRIGKYDPVEARIRGIASGAASPDLDDDPGVLPTYDLEGLRKYGRLLQPGEEVIVTEKIHGANGRAVVIDGRFYIGSRSNFWKPESANWWAEVARRYGLADRLAGYPGAIYFEVFGPVQDLRYGKDALELAVFDVLDWKARRWLDHDDVMHACAALGLPMVPTLYRGAWDPSMSPGFAEGPSTLAGHVREGFVVRPAQERYDLRAGRVVLKMHGEGYLTRKAA
jgi:RNA ligase (TIGR02306 family)